MTQANINNLSMDNLVNASIKDSSKKWFIVDVSGKVLGRAATRIANILQGKHKVNYLKHLEDGDKVIVINADKIELTGKKWSQKKYYRHTGYVGHLRETTYKDLLDKKPTFILKKAVKGMLPSNRLANRQLKNLYVYVGDSHPHDGQKPEKLSV